MKNLTGILGCVYVTLVVARSYVDLMGMYVIPERILRGFGGVYVTPSHGSHEDTKSPMPACICRHVGSGISNYILYIICRIHI